MAGSLGITPPSGFAWLPSPRNRGGGFAGPPRAGAPVGFVGAGAGFAPHQSLSRLCGRGGARREAVGGEGLYC